MSKICSKCNLLKENDCFGIDNQKHDGLTSNCKECRLKYRRENRDSINNKAVIYRGLNKINISIKKKEKYNLNPEYIKEQSKKSYHKRMAINAEAINSKKVEWAKNNKAKRKDYWKKHYTKNRYKYIEKSILRNRTLKKAKIKGFDRELREIYDNCPSGYHVDHIVPLNHPDVCGLHVPWNLQYLLAEDNLKKGNNFECQT